jgi:hypothetical protein
MHGVTKQVTTGSDEIRRVNARAKVTTFAIDGLDICFCLETL